MLHVLIINYRSFGDKPTFYFSRSPSLYLINFLHWPYFFFDEFIKAVTVLVSNPIETGAADNFFFKSFIKIETFLPSDENVDDLNLR